MSLSLQNLLEIWRRFEANTQAFEALEELDAQAQGRGEWDLEELLRHHSEEPVEDDDEISMRDAFDDLLALCGCLEIASTVGFVSDPLPPKYRERLLLVLVNADVQRYYQKHYPLFLPDMLLTRLMRIRSDHDKHTAESVALFLEFLHINSILENDPDVEILLWFMDDGFHRGQDFSDTLEILESPGKFGRALQRPPGRRTPAEEAVNGFRPFLSYCVAFDDLLQRARRYPKFQSAMWEYHGYWFRVVRGDVRDSVEAALEKFEMWLASPASRQLEPAVREMLKATAVSSLRQVRTAVRRLTGRSYGQSILKARANIRRDSARARALLGKRTAGRRRDFHKNTSTR